MNAISAGTEHSLGLREDGSAVAWGDNEHGQSSAPSGRFGPPDFGPANASRRISDKAPASVHMDKREQSELVQRAIGDDQTSIGRVEPSSAMNAISAGFRHSLGLRKDGRVVGWGKNDDGECNAPPGRYIAISAGFWHSLGLREDGSVVGWGWNRSGACDAPPGRYIAISAGGRHSLWVCARTAEWSAGA